MRLPNFLIIGSMKSGTTGVFLDLCRHPLVFEQQNKEPHFLCNDRVLTPAGLAEYAELYKEAPEGQLLCDASTGYTKMPDHMGVPQRAVQVLPNDFRAIYIIRDPIDRIASQHYHEFSLGLVGPDINTVVREHPRYIQYSRYAWQLEPWAEAIGRERIHVMCLEQYKSARSESISQACRFLGLDPAELPSLEAEKVHNAGDRKPVPGPVWNAIRGNKMYQKLIRPLFSARMRHHARKYFMAKAPERPAPPSEETIAWLEEQLADDVRQLEAEWGVKLQRAMAEF